MLVTMATGTGKTLMTVNEIYRLTAGASTTQPGILFAY
jgi:type I site-specific restriction endonuclease